MADIAMLLLLRRRLRKVVAFCAFEKIPNRTTAGKKKPTLETTNGLREKGARIREIWLSN
jgi:hypothetical protein